MWRTVAVVLGSAVLVVAGAVAGSALAAAAGGGTVYIATGENFPDAVAAGAAGGAADGPVLLVRNNSIPAPTLSELNRLQPFLIVIVGGTGVISPGVEDQLKALSFNPIVLRKGGADRYETAALLSQDTFPKVGGASCPSVGFYPPNSSGSYEGVDRRYLSSGSPIVFLCEVALPHGATVTKLSAGFEDTDPVNNAWCQLWRIDIIGGTFSIGIGSAGAIAMTPSTTGAAGEQRRSTTFIDTPVINTARYGYFFRCVTGPDLKILGATVEYELSN